MRTGRRWLWLLAVLVILGSALAWLGPHRDRPAFIPKVSFPLAAAEGTLAPPPVEETRLLDVAPDQARQLNDEQPFVTTRPDPARPFGWHGDGAGLDRAVDCLAAAAWYEAGDDPLGERSVIQVVLNRVRHPAFPGSVCGVVFQGAERSTGCQFTFTCDGAMARIPSDTAWQRARMLARAALSGSVDMAVGTATHYHTNWVVPYWRSTLEKIAQVRTHLFYRWPGYWGRTAAFRRDGFDPEPFVPKLAALSAAHRGGAEGTALAGLTGNGITLSFPAAVADAAALRNGIVRAQAEHANTYFLQVDPLAFPGSFAIRALSICKGKSPCRVLAWHDQTAMAVALPLGERQARALSFYYSHDDAGGDRALWNCADFKRSNATQCLPASPTDIEALTGHAQ
ncbi:MAG TPA: cell wall hydrolase [Novosphingobium sp.]